MLQVKEVEKSLALKANKERRKAWLTTGEDWGHPMKLTRWVTLGSRLSAQPCLPWLVFRINVGGSPRWPLEAVGRKPSSPPCAITSVLT